MLVHREHLLGLFVSLLTFYRKGALFSIPFGFYWIINTPDVALSFHGAEDEEFKKGMHLFSEFVELIDVLKSVTNSEHPRG
ncbi:hypothetical protein GsuE55_25200 [Geobacillus subterraneus]|uniref:Uncharacterized protein n=1 Tax=Geobacillus subterraneus TaxID=129338 RepID=A0A679FTV1_9BACL|nr:hypothetical protein GsuE55_25200 [Geobacillus subterraneus]